MKQRVMKEGPRARLGGEQVMRGEFDQIAQSLSARVDEQRRSVKQLVAAHRPTREAKRKLAKLTQALERVHALRSRLTQEPSARSRVDGLARQLQQESTR